MTEAEEQHMREELRENTKMTSRMYAMLVENGLVKNVADIKNNMQTRDGCEQMRNACEAVRVASALAHGKWWKSIDRIIVIAISVLTLLMGAGILTRSVANAKQNAKAIVQNEQAIELLQELKAEVEK